MDYGKLKVFFNDTGAVVTLSPRYRSIAKPMQFFGDIAYVPKLLSNASGLIFVAGNRELPDLLQSSLSFMAVMGEFLLQSSFPIIS